ncbi:MAG: hypothetical protein RLZZ628_384 [Bacteroidota bacterium]|jgi:hypothetical protein
MENGEKVALGAFVLVGLGVGVYFLTQHPKDKSGNPIVPLGEGDAETDGDGTRDEYNTYSQYILTKWESDYTQNAFEESKFAVCKEWYPQEDIKNMTLSRAQDIVYRDYWLKYNIHKLPLGLRMIVLDACINQGQPTGIRMLQRVGGVSVDGVNGAKTQAAADNVTIYSYCEERKKQYHSSASKKGRAQSLQGWLNRLEDVQKKAISLI